jgi:hypothetical protein
VASDLIYKPPASITFASSHCTGDKSRGQFHLFFQIHPLAPTIKKHADKGARIPWIYLFSVIRPENTRPASFYLLGEYLERCAPFLGRFALSSILTLTA